MSDLNKLLTFVRFTHQTHTVERLARIPGTTRRATTVEHSYQLTLLAWYLIEHEKLNLDKNLVIQYALVHDLVETYAGDTPIYDTSAQKTKAQREHDAQQKMQEEFPDFSDLHSLIARYENREDAEARFVYALDKLIDPLNIYLENGKLWHEEGITLSQLLAYKTDKIKHDATVHAYFTELVTLLRKREHELFPSTQKLT